MPAAFIFVCSQLKVTAENQNICVSLGQPCQNGESVRFGPDGESGGGSCGVWCFAARGVNGGALNAIRCLKVLEFNWTCQASSCNDTSTLCFLLFFLCESWSNTNLCHCGAQESREQNGQRWQAELHPFGREHGKLGRIQPEVALFVASLQLW